MTKYFSAYGIALVLFLIIDGLWLGIVARNFYAVRMGDLMSDSPRWGMAAVFYIFYLVGLVYFAISVGITNASWTAAAFNGALYGFFCYLTYNFTNLSVVRDFDTTLAFADTAWGTLMSAAVSAGTVAALQWLGHVK
ncbi:DUF2177 family protein [Aliihoeflea sp. PC F10.4]